MFEEFLLGKEEILRRLRAAAINTPPQDHLPIKSFIAERNSQLIKNAFMRELSRDGQAFFIHNRIENLTFTAERQSGKTLVKKTMALPRTKKPDELEKQVIAILTENFGLKSNR